MRKTTTLAAALGLAVAALITPGCGFAQNPCSELSNVGQCEVGEVLGSRELLPISDLLFSNRNWGQARTRGNECT